MSCHCRFRSLQESETFLTCGSSRAVVSTQAGQAPGQVPREHIQPNTRPHGTARHGDSPWPLTATPVTFRDRKQDVTGRAEKATLLFSGSAGLPGAGWPPSVRAQPGRLPLVWAVAWAARAALSSSLDPLGVDGKAAVLAQPAGPPLGRSLTPALAPGHEGHLGELCGGDGLPSLQRSVWQLLSPERWARGSKAQSLLPSVLSLGPAPTRGGLPGDTNQP